jgi:hypothetical protein
MRHDTANNFDTRPNGPYTFYPTFVHPEVIAFSWEGHSFFVNATTRNQMGIGGTTITRQAKLEKRCP